MICPVCNAPLAFHNDETARLHYATWLRTLEALARPFPVGEYDGHRRVIHVQQAAA